jgi:adenylate kinase family enzyme
VHPAYIADMKRVVILGRGASGKSTLAVSLGEITGLPVIELDKVFWQRGLVARRRDQWVAIQERLVAEERWIMDGDLGPYDAVEIRLRTADTILFLDLSLLRCAWRAIRRSRERADFWWWLLTYHWRGRPILMEAIANHAVHADLHTFRNPEALRRFVAEVAANRGLNRKQHGMNSADVVHLYTTLEKSGVEIWIDGGWGVDALLGDQTRLHKDLDITIQQKDVPMLRRFLQTCGYRKIKLEDAKSWNFVLGDENGKEIDVHVIVLDDKGNGLYGPPEKGEMYPTSSLTGTGVIEGRTVRCISPEWMVKFHSGYPLKEKDFRDVSALCKKFGIDLPAEYEQFNKSE